MGNIAPSAKMRRKSCHIRHSRPCVCRILTALSHDAQRSVQ